MTAIFYGSSTGATQTLAKEIAAKLGVADIFDVSDASADKAAGYDTLLLGSSTWGYGELQDDWYNFLPELKKQNLGGKKVALFGCGDADSYPDTFCDAMGLIKEELAGTGCTFVGEYPADGYSTTDSKAFEGGNTIGLAVDDNQTDLTASRLDTWAALVK